MDSKSFKYDGSSTLGICDRIITETRKGVVSSWAYELEGSSNVLATWLYASHLMNTTDKIVYSFVTKCGERLPQGTKVFPLHASRVYYAYWGETHHWHARVIAPSALFSSEGIDFFDIWCPLFDWIPYVYTKQSIMTLRPVRLQQGYWPPLVAYKVIRKQNTHILMKAFIVLRRTCQIEVSVSSYL